jgi:hypothetical protein
MRTNESKTLIAQIEKGAKTQRDLVGLALHGPRFSDDVALARRHKAILDTRSRGGSTEREEEALKEAVVTGRKAQADAEAALRSREADSSILLQRGATQQRAALLRGGALVAIAAKQPFDQTVASAAQSASALAALTATAPKRHWNLAFLGPYASGFDSASSHELVEGAVGWRGLPRIDNDDTDQDWTAILSIWWSGIVPSDGTFTLGGLADTYLNLNWKTTGSGLWGADAKAAVTYYTWVSVGQQWLHAYSEHLVDETESSYGSTEGSVGRWLPSGFSGMVRAAEGDPIWAGVQLEIDTWSDDGRAWVRVDDFWIPVVDPDTDVFIAD